MMRVVALLAAVASASAFSVAPVRDRHCNLLTLPLPAPKCAVVGGWRESVPAPHAYHTCGGHAGARSHQG